LEIDAQRLKEATRGRIRMTGRWPVRPIASQKIQ
jgi:hypothetical protein